MTSPIPVTGRVVGVGSDGEPLLKGVRCLPYPLHVGTKARIPASTQEYQDGAQFPQLKTKASL